MGNPSLAETWPAARPRRVLMIYSLAFGGLWTPQANWLAAEFGCRTCLLTFTETRLQVTWHHNFEHQAFEAIETWSQVTEPDPAEGQADMEEFCRRGQELEERTGISAHDLLLTNPVGSHLEDAEFEALFQGLGGVAGRPERVASGSGTAVRKTSSPGRLPL